MDFFERQDQARRKTGRLVVLFVIAVVMIVAALNLAAFGILRVAGEYERSRRDAAPVLRGDTRYPGQFSPEIKFHERYEPYIAVTLVTLGIIICGSAYKTLMLAAGGGPAVAQMMGGRPVAPDPDDPQEKMLRNVVEEMSIASGVPVPQLFVMDTEDGINAFAAGFTPADAVIAVTRGSLEQLNRDELQGVIAHEFSHILNGDMRLNLRLIGILNGILVIALIGYMILRSVPYMGSGRRRDSKDSGGQMVIVILLAGAAMVVIGYVGVFFGRLIQAAVSRQREYLADASAVQFTRNPSGLAGALKKIAGISAGSSLNSPHALEVAHLFFASGIKIGLTELLATHPPIAERIRALDPTFSGEIAASAPRPPIIPPPLPVQPLAASQIVGSAGAVTPPHVEAARQTLANIPPDIAAAAHDPFAARAVALALLMSSDESVRTKQVASLQATIDSATIEQTMKLAPTILPLDRPITIALMDLIQPALMHLSRGQLQQFANAAKALIEADGRVTLFEYAMYRQLRRQLEAAVPGRRAQPAAYFSMAPLMEDAVTVLSALAYSGKDPARGAKSFAAGAARLDPSLNTLAANDYGLNRVDAALTRLADASPGVKRKIIDAAAHAVAEDGMVQPEEAELLRAICAALGVPLPITSPGH